MAWFGNLRELLGINNNEKCLCMVVTEQEGAEIWIEGKKTAFVTPKLVALPKNCEVKITVKMIGHHDHTAVVRSSHNLTYYHCKLERIPLRLINNERSATAFI